MAEKLARAPEERTALQEDRGTLLSLADEFYIRRFSGNDHGRRHLTREELRSILRTIVASEESGTIS